MPSTKNIELYYQHRPAANITALKAVNTTSIVDGEICNVSGLGTWQFIKASTATADDITVVAPTTGGGRWLKQTIIEADGSVKLPKTLNANSLAIKSLLNPVDPQDAATKSWVESQIVTENLWDRSGTTLLPHNAGDIAAYTSHPTFTADAQLIDKKYADELFATGFFSHDYWTPAHTPITPGQTIFTLSSTPVSANKSILTWNGVQQEYGVQYTISGATLTWLGVTLAAVNSIEIWYNINSNGYVISLNEKQIYYVNDNGDNSNNGLSVNAPLKTIGAAVVLVLAQIPSSTNKFEIQVIGSGIYNETIVIVPYTYLNAPGATINGRIILQDYASANVGTLNIAGPSVVPAVHSDIAVNTFFKCNLFNAGNGVSTCILCSQNSSLHVDIQNLVVGSSCNVFGVSGSSSIYAKVGNIDASASGSSIASLVSNSNLYLTADNILQNVSPYHDSNSQYYITANNYEKSPFVARTIVDVTNFCGDNGTYVVPLAYTLEYNGESMNKGGYYNDSTYKVSYPFNCLVDFKASILLKNITAASHTYGELAINVYNASNVLQQTYPLDLKNINNTAGASPIAPSNALILNGAADVVMPAGYYAQLVVLVEGLTKEITLNGSSLAASRFSGTIKQIL